MTITSAPVVRTVDALPAVPITDPTDERARNWWPSRCDVCKVSAWFPSRRERLSWELRHEHGGAD